MIVGITLALSYRVYNCLNVLLNFCISPNTDLCYVVCSIIVDKPGISLHLFCLPAYLSASLFRYCLFLFFFYIDYHEW